MIQRIDKRALMKKICEHIELELAALRQAALATYQAATDEEAKPENKYDTRSLEASYLAGAQAKRVREIEDLLKVYRLLSLPAYAEEDKIGPASLVALEWNGKKLVVFVMPKGGGLTVQIEKQNVQVVSPESPLGAALVGMRVGDEARVEVGPSVRDYEILEIA